MKRTILMIVLIAAVLSAGAASSYTTATVDRNVSITIVDDGSASLELAGSQTLNEGGTAGDGRYYLVNVTNRFSDGARVTVEITQGDFRFPGEPDSSSETKTVNLQPGEPNDFEVEQTTGTKDTANYRVTVTWANGGYSAEAFRTAEKDTTTL